MSAERDRQLLRRFEPVLRFTRGEQFFPMDAEQYVRACSLWAQRPGREAVQLVPQGELTLDRLATPFPAEFGATHFLRLTEPLTAPELAAYKLQQYRSHSDPRQEFHAGLGRLARVGYASRFVDALFSLGLLARGRVPGDMAAAAAIIYQRLPVSRQYCYYGRVVHQNGWVVLQYWFFYLFNNWRSGFFGANDHEADWEMACVYLAEAPDGDPQPEWVAYASHDYAGADLRRRWDDPEVEKVGEHPVVYVGAGSHANYFAPGEYLTKLELPFLARLNKVTDRLRLVWHEWLHQYREDDDALLPRRTAHHLSIPFVDYARGDGLAIGPGQEIEWAPPRVLDPCPSWVTDYHGLWGFYARDPFAGEDAPAGPMYNRAGITRRAWDDPVGWAGLDTTTPSPAALAATLDQMSAAATRRQTLAKTIEEHRRELLALGVEVAAMAGHPHLREPYAIHQRRIQALWLTVTQLRTQLAAERAIAEALERHAARLHAGIRPPARAHLQRPAQPLSPIQLRTGRLAELWAAMSVGVMLLGFVGLIFFARQYLLVGLLAALALLVFIEAGFRGRIIRLVTQVTLGLAAIAALVLVYEFFWPLVILAVLGAGSYILWENLRELWT